MAEEAAASTDGGEGLRAYTVRLELVDEPGELLNALRPIAENGGNLLSIYHERGSLTPRGRIPVEVDVECAPERFDRIVTALRETGVNVIQAGEERYSEALTVLLVGHLIETDLSGTLNRLEESTNASVVDLSLAAPQGTAETSSARLRFAVETNGIEATLAAVRDLADEKDLLLIEPQVERGP